MPYTRSLEGYFAVDGVCANKKITEMASDICWVFRRHCDAICDIFDAFDTNIPGFTRRCVISCQLFTMQEKGDADSYDRSQL